MPSNWTLYSFDTLSSTQDTARDYMAEGRPLPFAIRADMQTAARGRGGNKWVCLPDNLYTSLVVDVDGIAARYAGQYSFLAAVALMDTLTKYGVSHARNKWPNDILVDGKKIAGILLESDVSAEGCVRSLIIGVGVNLSSAPDGAASVKECGGVIVSPHDFLQKFITLLQMQLDTMTTKGFAAIRRQWLEKAYGLGTDIRVRLPREAFTGTFLGLDEDGALLVKLAAELSPRVIHSGDVFFEQKET